MSVPFALLVGLAAIGAVLLGVPRATAIVEDGVPVAANTGLGFVLLATAVLAAHRPTRVLRIAGPVAAVAAVLLAALSLVETLGDRDLGVNRWIFPAPPGASEMSPQTAVAFLLLGGTVLATRTSFGRVATQIAAGVTMLLALINILDAIFGATTPTILGRYTQMALPTATTFAALALGVAALHPRGTLLEQIRLPGPTGTLTRRLLVATIAIPVAVGWLRLAGERAGWYDSAYGVAITTLATMTLFVIAVRITGRSIEQAEEERRVAEAERRRVQEELAEAHGEIAELWDRAPIGYHSLDADGRFVHINQTELDLLGYDRDEVVGKLSFADLLTPSGLATFRVTFPRFKAEGELRDVEFELRRRDGSIVPVRISATAVRDADGRYLASRSAVRDISAQRAAEAARELAREEAEAASAAKSQFLSRMSHELRTPLNSVLGFAQLLEADDLTPDQRESVTYIRRAGRHLLDLINEVLDISRIEQGRLTISVEPVILRETLDEVTAFVQPMAGARGISVEIEQGQCHPVVMADRQRLRQVLLNLLTNAVKYNREGGSITVGCQILSDGRIRVDVTDTGPGIPVLSRVRLFQPFDRLGAEASGVEGAGMGLALSKALMSAMNGEIGVETEVGVGSTFWIALPRGSVMPDATPEPATPGAAADGHPATTILYIEDNPANLRLVERIVASMPHMRLLPAIQGRIGVDLAREHRPGVVLLDLHLPDMDGRDVLAELRAYPGTRDIPVVILSADASESQCRRLIEAGAFDFLTKPIDKRELVATLERALLVEALPGRPDGS